MLSPRLRLYTSILAALFVPAIAGAQLKDLGSNDISFLATGPMGMKIKGSTSELALGDDGKVVDVQVPLAKLSTGIALRDKHMKEKYLEVQKYPTAELKVPKAMVHVPAAGQQLQGKFSAPLVLHGKTLEVIVGYTARRDGDRVHVDASFQIDMRRFGIEQPTYMGVTVKPQVDVEARFDVADR
jgi:polyisoprenoid-binding protein YceI